MLIPCTDWEYYKKEEFQEKYKPFQKAINTGIEKGYQFHDFTQDLFSSLYQLYPRFPEKASKGTEWAKKILDEMKDLPEYKQIRDQGTLCNSFQSGLGATVLAEQFVESLPKTEQENPDEIQKRIDNINSLLEDLPESDLKNGFAEKAKDEEASIQASQDAWQGVTDGLDPSDIRQALRQALTAAHEQIQKAEEEANAFGFGHQPGEDGYGGSAELKLQIAEKIRSSHKLQEIAKLAGRFRREARKEQANKKQPAKDEVTDIELGNDLGRLVPSELMKLGHPLTRLDFMRKYLERSLIQYKLEEVPKENRGPIIICVDNSSSMTMNNREIWSKAICLALLQIGIDQKRIVEVIHFDTLVQNKYVFDGKKKIDPRELVACCEYFSNGGTEFGPVLTEASRDILSAAKAKFEKADIIFITDGIAPVDQNVKDVINNLRKHAKTKLYTILLGSYTATALPDISDYTTMISDLFADGSDKDVKEMVFSI